MKMILAAALAVLPLSAQAAPDVVTPADTIHPNIHTKVGRGDGTNANPNGANENGGRIHGIANVPGQDGGHPNADGVRGQANELETVHGGIGSKNRNAD
jgi:opacity protein-like surface antigen